MDLADIPTPVLIVDLDAFDHNVATMAAALPGPRCRPHVKAFKSTALAARLVAAGHRGFCCATPREMIGMAAAGQGDDLLLANEVLDPARLAVLGALDARVTVAVDSDATIDAAAKAGIREVLIDVNVGLPRCGCDPTDAGRLADRARRGGLTVRGVMGYEGHLVGNPDRAARADGLAVAMELLLGAHAEVGGDVISGGGTGTYDLNHWVNEVQAGSYTLMDTAYAELGLPFREALTVVATVVSRGASRGKAYAVADAGLKALGMDHGNPAINGASVWFCSDEHTTFAAAEGGRLAAVGDRVAIRPADVDPTVAYHERYLVAWGGLEGQVVDEWAIDLRNW